LRGLRAQLLQQRLRVLEVRRVEAFGEPGVDGLEQIAGVGALALALPEVGEGGGGAQLEGLRLLAPRDFEGPVEEALGLRLVPREQEVAFQAQ